MPATERLLAAVAVALLLVANLLPGETAELRRDALARGELWRLWTGQFCHWSGLHLAGNLAAVAAVVVVIGRSARGWLATLPLAAPLLSLFLLAADPALTHYRGLSGLVALLVVGAAVDGGPVGRLLAAAYGAKLAFDAASGATSPLLPDGVAIAWTAHLGGLLLGLGVAGGRYLRRSRG